jgi:hypothetical protein
MSQNAPAGAEARIRPPYISYKTFKNFLDSFESSEQIPSHIDRSVLPTSMSGGNQVGVIATLRFFNLISENGAPHADFYEYVDAQEEGKKRVLRRILSEGYSFLMNGLDIERATTKQVIDKFKEVGVSGDTVRKAIVFFLFAAKDAELKISSHIKPYMGSRINKGVKQRGRTTSRGDDDSQEDFEDNADESRVEKPQPDKTPYQVLIDILSPDMEEDEQQAVWTLIRYLKRQEIMVE